MRQPWRQRCGSYPIESKLIETALGRRVRQSNVMRMGRPIRIERFAMEGSVGRQRPGFRRHGMSLMVIRWIYIVMMMMIIATPWRRTVMLARSTSASSAAAALFRSLLLLLMHHFLLSGTIGIGRPRRQVIHPWRDEVFLLVHVRLQWRILRWIRSRTVGCRRCSITAGQSLAICENANHRQLLSAIVGLKFVF